MAEARRSLPTPRLVGRLRVHGVEPTIQQAIIRAWNDAMLPVERYLSRLREVQNVGVQVGGAYEGDPEGLAATADPGDPDVGWSPGDHAHTGDHGVLTGLTDDDHPQYQKESEKGVAGGYASLDGGGTVPDAEIPSGIARDSEVSAAISTHEAASDPHPGYQLESEKGSASGYASLDGSALVPTTQLPNRDHNDDLNTLQGGSASERYHLTQAEHDPLAAVASLLFTGTGSPEGVVTAGVGSLFLRTDGGTSTTLYVKESGAGSSGWIAK